MIKSDKPRIGKILWGKCPDASRIIIMDYRTR